MIELQSFDDYYIQGRGTVFICKNEVSRSTVDLVDEYRDKEVKINGEVYKVRGVETYCVQWQHEGVSFGLLVNANK